MAEGYEAERFLEAVKRWGGTPEELDRRRVAMDRVVDELPRIEAKLAEFPRIEAKLDVLLANQKSGVQEWKFWLGLIAALALPALGGYTAVVRMDQRIVKVDETAANLKQDVSLLAGRLDTTAAAQELRAAAARDRRDAQIENVKQQVGAVDRLTAGIIADVGAIRTGVEALSRRFDQLEGRRPGPP